MKALAVFPTTREVRSIEIDEPQLQTSHQVKLKVLEVGVCGTDREICGFHYGTPPEGSDYLVLGHECLARVEEIGPGVTRVAPGDLVVPTVRRPCPHPHCRACQAGRQDFCYTGDFRERGIKAAHGFNTEWIVEEEQYLVVVPHELRQVGVLVEPLTIAEKALIQLRSLQERLPWQKQLNAVILGAGPVGILGAMVFMRAGFQTYVYSRDVSGSAKAKLVESMGGFYVSSQEHDAAQLAQKVGHIDVVFEALGASKIAFEVMPHMANNGTFIFTGVPGHHEIQAIDTDLLMRNLVLKNQVVLGTVNAGLDGFQAAVDDLFEFRKRWPQQLEALITGRFPVSSHAELLATSARGSIKSVFVLETV